MKNIVKDIKKNCPECHCDTEQTIKFLVNHGDINFTSEHYREVWYFYQELLKNYEGKPFAKKLARSDTIEMFKISPAKFKYIQRWCHKTGLTI